jgi:hypothetical protein
MSKVMGTFHNVETGEVVVRELNAEELEVYKILSAADEKLAIEEAQRDSDREALLAKLGITADEAKLLLG